ncbi:MAG: hypothetical protein QNJ29_04220 [Rhizobiaceae bacterium]|nr:hypothetical protein [Rhizobiaceae bacterium]
MRRQTANLATLKHVVSSLEGRNEHQFVPDPASDATRLTFGEELLDDHLEGGLLSGCMHEIRCDYARDIGAASAFLCAFLARNHARSGKLVWIVDPAARIDAGQMSPDGLWQLGLDPSDVILVHPRDLKTAIWTAGESAREGGLAAIVFQVKGNPKMLDLSVSRKLMLRAQASQTPFFLLRQGGQEEASSATTRWQVTPLSSDQNQDFKQGIGPMRHRLTLERNRTGQTGNWPVSWQSAQRTFRHAATKISPTRYLSAVSTSRDRPDLPLSMGQIMAFERAS